MTDETALTKVQLKRVEALKVAKQILEVRATSGPFQSKTEGKPLEQLVELAEYVLFGTSTKYLTLPAPPSPQELDELRRQLQTSPILPCNDEVKTYPFDVLSEDPPAKPDGGIIDTTGWLDCEPGATYERVNWNGRPAQRIWHPQSVVAFDPQAWRKIASPA